MINSVDFAKYILLKAQEKNIDLNMTRLQKIIYICDGSMLALGYNIINENCRVWEHGPVYPKVYKWHDKNRNTKIKVSDISLDVMNEINDTELSKVVDLALNKFGKWTAVALSEWSHQIGSPWDIAKSNKGMFSKINKDDMRSYFKGLLNVE